MITAEASAMTNRPVEEVFQFTNDLDKVTQWQGNLVQTKQTSDGPMGVGSTFDEIRQAPGRKVKSTWEITEYEPNGRVQWKTTAGPIPMEGSTSFESTEEGTRVTFILEARPTGLYGLLQPIIGRAVRKQVKSDLESLKILLESQS